ncbi:phage antirepressor N-terminal domain-containing protein [Methylobacterium sp. J-048]|uniref:phage antirepressor N-terminal domain-containing protein n=1 Tax=Methylobacterium sp. J-048 TaxID=2836635 RepID=UPI001FB9C690|nr:phage antirepressor N-terminal domain-containing protein [Methylobacterium sp. J-048]MCJ2059810.1 phage antirepressor N-terminal domain-containing protein [Methylobacterium sp. J-048]
MQQLTTVEFRGDTLFAVEEPDGVFVAVKPICQRFGLAWNGQLERIKRDPILIEGMREIRIPSPGGDQETVCLALRLINGWLFGIGVNQVKPELREDVLAYKRECYETLADRFLGPRAAERPIHAPAPEAIEERNLRAEEHKLNLVARMQAMKGPAHAFALYQRLGLPVAEPLVLPDPVAAALETLAREQGPWTGTATQLHAALCEIASAAHLSDPRWPSHAQAVGMAVKRLTPQLAQRGVRIERRHSGETRITVALVVS